MYIDGQKYRILVDVTLTSMKGYFGNFFVQYVDNDDSYDDDYDDTFPW